MLFIVTIEIMPELQLLKRNVRSSVAELQGN
jgi:hypothetical protein